MPRLLEPWALPSRERQKRRAEALCLICISRLFGCIVYIFAKYSRRVLEQMLSRLASLRRSYRQPGRSACCALAHARVYPGIIHWFLRLSGIGNHSYPMIVILPDLLVVEVLFKTMYPRCTH